MHSKSKEVNLKQNFEERGIYKVGSSIEAKFRIEFPGYQNI